MPFSFYFLIIHSKKAPTVKIGKRKTWRRTPIDDFSLETLISKNYSSGNLFSGTASGILRITDAGLIWGHRKGEV